MKEKHGIAIIEAYRNYKPPIDASKVVNRLLSHIPKRYVSGLKTVVLTNSGNLNSKRKRAKTWSRKKKVLLRDCVGLYYESWENNPASIELFVDNIATAWPTKILHIPLFLDMAFSDALFHELGHHIHKTQAPEFKERENVADQWRKKLSRRYFRRYHWYLFPIALMLCQVRKIINKKRKS
ncbi:MAG: hypothetical protein GXO98_06635 [Nitrospirae bacterium]|nr:hypothetical protein [Nitrospirota bacterium]